MHCASFSAPLAKRSASLVWPGEWLELLQSLLLVLEVPSSIVTGKYHQAKFDNWPVLSGPDVVVKTVQNPFKIPWCSRQACSSCWCPPP